MARKKASLPIKTETAAELIERELPLSLIITKIKEGLDAWQIPTRRGVDLAPIPDFRARHGYAQLALQLRGQIVTKIEHTGPNGTPIQFEVGPNLSGLSNEQLKMLESILKVVPDGSTDPQTGSE